MNSSVSCLLPLHTLFFFSPSSQWQRRSMNFRRFCRRRTRTWSRWRRDTNATWRRRERSVHLNRRCSPQHVALNKITRRCFFFFSLIPGEPFFGSFNTCRKKVVYIFVTSQGAKSDQFCLAEGLKVEKKYWAARKKWAWSVAHSANVLEANSCYTHYPHK